MRPIALTALALLCVAPAAHAAIGTPTLAWQRCAPAYCERGWYGSPAVTDVDGDGVVDVLGGGYTLLSARGDTGALQWSYAGACASDHLGRLWTAPAVADLDGDGDREIVVVQHEQIAVLDHEGDPLAEAVPWVANPLAPCDGGAEMRTLAVADLDRDGAGEILAARASGGSIDTWSVFDAELVTRDGWPRLAPGDPGAAWGAYNQNLAVGDLLGDGALEIAASSDVHYLAAFDADGAILPANAIYGPSRPWWSQVGVHFDHAVDLRGYANCDAGPPLEPRPNFADAPPSIGDLDGDGVNEIVVVGGFYDCRTANYDQLFQVPMIFRADRTRWSNASFDWTTPPTPDASFAPLSIDYDVIETAETNPVLADLDGDGVQEILYASYDGRVHAYWLDRTEHGAWPFDVTTTPTERRFASEPAVVDLDADGDAEVLFATWPEKGKNLRGDLVVVDATGIEIARVPLPVSAQSWDGALGAPTVANLDADPALEVVVNTAHTGLVAYEIPGSTAGGRRPWPTGRGNLARTAPEAGGGGVALGCLLALARRQRGVTRTGT